jgi:hypothetical protein
MMRTAMRLLVAAALGVGATLSASPAYATDPAVVDTDRFMITAKHADFGDGNLGNISGKPTENGKLEWYFIGGEFVPLLTGKVFINNASGSCVRMQMTFNWSGADVTHSDDTYCAPNGQTWYADIYFAPFSDATITSVTVKLQYREKSYDPWTTVGSSTWIPT